MFYLKKTIWVLVIFSIITGTAFGQPGNNRGQRNPDRDQTNRPHQPMVPDSAQTIEMVDELATALSLTEDEKEAVLELHFLHFAKVKELMEQTSGDRKSHREQMDALRSEFQKEIKALLNEEQFEKFEEFMKKRNPRSGPPNGR